jgi:hypothetical protein
MSSEPQACGALELLKTGLFSIAVLFTLAAWPSTGGVGGDEGVPRRQFS